MPQYRSRTSTAGRNMAGARALWRATGMQDGDFEKPIIAVVNSFTQFVPGHVHLKDLGQLVAREIEASGGVAKEFNTIAVDDGIAMGHDGMLYSLPSRDLIADSVEYMVNAHCADAMVCISNCDKITPGMLNAAMRLNIPVIFVSGGPMEAGKTALSEHKLDLVDAMVIAADSSADDATVEAYERSACPTCGSCSGMFTANSMNCLTEALGLSLPGNGSLLATHADREQLFLRAGRLIVEVAKRWYEQDDKTALPREIASKKAFENAMTLDVAMGGSTNTILHLLAAAQEAGVDFDMADIDTLSTLDTDRHSGCVRDMAHAYSQEGGLAVLFGNIAEAGCVVKTAGVDDASLRFSGPAHICESQEGAVSDILEDRVKAGDVVVIRYEGPRGGPGMQEMLYPTSYLKSKDLGKACALITDGRFSGGTSGLSIGHVSPEAAAGGAIALIEPGDIIEINIPERQINVLLDQATLAGRRDAMNHRARAWKPVDERPRKVSTALKVYASMVTSADKGAIRDSSLIDG